MDNSILQLAKQAILVPTGLQEREIFQVMDQLLNGSVDNGDIYFQSSHYESWVLEDGIIKEGSHNIEQGAGVRALSGEKTGFAYSDKIDLSELLTAVNNVQAIARQGQAVKIALPSSTTYPQLYAPINPLSSLSDQEKVDFLHKIDTETRKLDPRIEQVIISLVGVQEHILIANQGDSLIGDSRPLVRMNVSVIVEEKGQREQGSMGGGARADYHYFLEQDRALGYAQEAVRQALVNLQAVPAPAGSMPVVLGSGWPGILLHEAIG
ncbi:MAG: metalloprotease TldD, partial [Gammaproteobacteria bacterium]